jgi:uncharacterized protein YecE (DUF72 family)
MKTRLVESRFRGEFQLKPDVHIGPAGWSYPDWDGIVYPKVKGPRFDALAYLASYFDLIEINSTFYRVPTSRVCRDWSDRVAGSDSFRFTVKVHRELTHGRGLARESEVNEFKTAIEPMVENDKLGSLLIQFPWSFKNSVDTRRYIGQLTGWLRPLPASVEVRHGSWRSREATRFFRDNDIPLCGVDQPMIGDSLGPETFEPGGSHAYFRLHGRNRHNWFKPDAGRDDRYNYLYSSDELSSWRERIDSVPAGVERLFVVLNNHFRGQAVANALQLRSMLSGRKTDAPPELIDTFPGLGDSLRPVRPKRNRTRSRRAKHGQLDLFENDNEK